MLVQREWGVFLTVFLHFLNLYIGRLHFSFSLYACLDTTSLIFLTRSILYGPSPFCFIQKTCYRFSLRSFLKVFPTILSLFCLIF
jgi:hypothetical protein